MKHRFFNMYLTATISVALVLFLIGLECITLLSAHQMIQRLKENVALTIVLKDNATEEQITRLGEVLEMAPYSHEVRYISKEQALEEHIQALGEDPQKFLGYNPLSNTYEMALQADYAQEDSICTIEDNLMTLPYIQQVNHPQEIVSMLDLHVGEISVVLVVIALLLLLISWALIANTVRLQVYSKRFLINTMRLVGATPWVIRAPFVKRNVLLGFEAGLVALVALALAVYYVHIRLGVWVVELTWQNMLIVGLVVLLGGELITFFASFAATSRYIRMKIDKMYEI
ncbi:MAG: permease-like cell division protein FtsX [Paludibacteraceae bacterium]|nr:permease-like cell division protein FtsX [Paludibacteraceae bacterium]